MQGFKVLLLDDEGKPANHGTILRQIMPESYLVQFAKAPASCRICGLAEMSTWQLFPNDKQMNAFIAAIVAAQKPPPAPPKKKAPRKKKVKSNGTK